MAAGQHPCPECQNTLRCVPRVPAVAHRYLERALVLRRPTTARSSTHKGARWLGPAGCQSLLCNPKSSQVSGKLCLGSQPLPAPFKLVSLRTRRLAPRRSRQSRSPRITSIENVALCLLNESLRRIDLLYFFFFQTKNALFLTCLCIVWVNDVQPICYRSAPVLCPVSGVRLVLARLLSPDWLTNFYNTSLINRKQ